jgi:hypothetical protein
MESAPPLASRLWKTLARDPLLHFLVLGGLVFTLDQLVLASGKNPRIIAVGPGVEQELRSRFRDAQGRAPTAAEIERLRARWVDEEVLYREGLALRLDQGDSVLRERLIHKVLQVLDSGARVPTPGEAELRTWFEQNRARYDGAASFERLRREVARDYREARAQAQRAAAIRELAAKYTIELANDES